MKSLGRCFEVQCLPPALIQSPGHGIEETFSALTDLNAGGESASDRIIHIPHLEDCGSEVNCSAMRAGTRRYGKRRMLIFDGYRLLVAPFSRGEGPLLKLDVNRMSIFQFPNRRLDAGS